MSIYADQSQATRIPLLEEKNVYGPHAEDSSPCCANQREPGSTARAQGKTHRAPPEQRAS